MKKIIALTTIIILIFTLSGCNSEKKTSIQDTSNSKISQQGKNGSTGSDSKANISPASQQPSGGTSVVAKSNNTVSSADKEKLLDEVDKELDALLNSINNLEDAQDSDLDFN